MATMSQSLRDRLFHALGNTWADEFEDLLDQTFVTAASEGLKQKIRFWLGNDLYADELSDIISGNLGTCSAKLKEYLRVALADAECGDDLVTLLNAILGSPNSPSATPSRTPSSTPSHTPSSTPSRTPSSTPSSTPSRTPSSTPSSTPSATPSGT